MRSIVGTVRVGLCALLCGCASKPQHAQTGVALPSGISASGVGTSGPLGALVPADATAAFIVRGEGLADVREHFARDPEMHKELGAYLYRVAGADFTQVQGVMGFVKITLGQKPSGAVVLQMPTPVQPAKLPVVGHYGGVSLLAVTEGIVAAAIPAGIVVGEESAVRAVLTPGKKGAGAPSLRGLGALGGDRVAVLAVNLRAIPDPGAAAMIAAFGLSEAELVYRTGGQLTLSVGAPAAKLDELRQMALAAIDFAKSALERNKASATSKDALIEGAAAIMSYHGMRKLLDEIAPKREGDELVSRYQLPKTEGSVMTYTAVAGIGAAVAIPAFMKYIRRSKTTEASLNLKLLSQHAAAYYEANRKRGARFSFPPSTDWTPAGGCCGGDGGKCAPKAETFRATTWKALEFNVTDPFYYQYRFTTTGRGKAARFAVEARGDLDCNGVFSHYRIQGTIDPKAGVRLGGLEIENDLE